MIRDYEIVSPSLEGVLSDEALMYDGIRRPTDILRVMDGPASRSSSKDDSDRMTIEDEHSQKVLEDYFHDLYGIFMKKLSFFVVQSESPNEDTVKLQAMLQEMTKVKRLIGRTARRSIKV